MPAFRTRAVAAATAVLLLAACSSSGSSSPGDGASASDDPAAQATAYAALSPEEQEAQLRTLSTDIEHQLLTLSGLEKELGGPEKATAAYDAMTAAMVAQIRKQAASGGFVGKFGGLARTADTPTLGGMIFAGMIVDQLAAGGLVQATNDLKPGAEPIKDVKKSGTDTTVTTEGTIASASQDFDIETTANGVTGKLRVKIAINPCPDATGTFTAHVTMLTSVTSSGGRVGQSTTNDITITGHVNDDAKLAGYDSVAKTEAAEFGSGANKWSEYTATTSWSGDKVTAASRTNGRTSGAVTPKFQQEWAQMGTLTELMVTKSVLEAAQKGWESGRCVVLVPTTSPAKRRALTPSTTVSITAPPRSKIDGGPVGGTVTAVLTGEAALDPSGSKVPADATFTYKAPAEKNKTGSVALEARSKRGVAKATVDFDTKASAYKVTGTLASAPSGTRFVGSICSPDQAFTVATSGDMVGTIAFTPTSDTAGKLVFSGRVGNAPFGLTGKGTYTLAEPADSGTGTLAIAWKVTIYIPKIGSRTNGGTVALTLTPTSAC